MKVDLYKCDNQFCKEEAETCNPVDAGWYAVHHDEAVFHFDSGACLMMWLQERIER